MAKNLDAFLKSERYRALVTKLEELEHKDIVIVLQANKTTTVNATGKLSDQTICITGSFEKSREEIKSILESHGAKVVDSVSKNTTILLVGEKAGSKLDKAHKLGIRVESDLQNLVD